MNSNQGRIAITKANSRIRVDGDVAYVTLTKGFVATIDAADVPLVGSHCWQAKVDKHTVYAISVKATRKVLRMHRVLMGKPPAGMQIDHIDRNGLNNRRSNLRLVTCRENLLNRRIVHTNSSGYRGVTYNDHRNKWRASIKHEGKQIVLGDFVEKVDAAKAFDAAAVKYRGEHAVLNFPAYQGENG